MSDINQNIDELFRDGLNNHTVQPPAYVWDSIDSKLGNVRTNGKRIVLWRSLAAAAFIGVLFLSSLLFIDLDKNLNTEDFISLSENLNKNIENKQPEKIESPIPSNKITKEKLTSDTLEAIGKSPIIDSNTKILAKVVIPADSKSKHNNNNNNNNNKFFALLNDTVTSEVASLEFVNTASVQESSLLVSDKKDNTQTFVVGDSTQVFIKHESQQLFAQNKPKKEYTPFNTQPSVYNPTKSKSKYIVTLSGQVAPGYSDKEVSGSASSASRESGISTLTGGLNLNIKTKKKWSIETGVYYSQSGQKFSNDVYSNDVPYFMSPGGSAIIEGKGEVPLSNSMGKIKLSSYPEFVVDNSNKIPSSSIPVNPEAPIANTLLGVVDIQQELDFVEVPLLVRYHIIDKNINLSLAGGMSTNFLINNDVYHLSGGSRTRIGETDQINDVNYSAVFGIGLQTPLWKSVHFNIEPRVKYFMNSISSDASTDYKPYSIGVFTGISYRF